MASRFFDAYFEYIGKNEAPTVFHRWTAISFIGTLLGRSIYLPFGHNKIFPNQYIMLTGTPGTRKGSALKIGKGLIEAIGYRHIAPNRAAKEAFWDWMAKQRISEEDKELGIEYDLDVDPQPTEAYVAHDEFLDFIGIGDDAFVTNLTNLWDNLPQFENPKTRGNSVFIPKPTVNIISGMTPAGISEAFRSVAMGGGFFSRMLFIYSKPTEIKITFPDPPKIELGKDLLGHMVAISELEGQIKLSKEVKELIEEIYNSCPGMSDPRFQFYLQRRLTHLLKLIMIISAMRLSLEPTVGDCLYANTILYNAELNMPKALGEYGKSKFAEVANNIVSTLNRVTAPLTTRQIWKMVARDLNKFADLAEILEGLTQAERIQRTTIKQGKGDVMAFIPNNVIDHKWPKHLVDFRLLKEDEHNQPLAHLADIKELALT